MIRSRKLYQLSVVTLLLLGFAPLQSQSVDVRPASPEEQVAAGFASPQLSPAQEQAFEQRARQIIMEFIDYYNLLCDPDLDSELRTVLLAELEQLLYHAEVPLQLNGQPAKTTLTSIDFSTATPISLQEVELLQTDATSGTPVWRYRVYLEVDKQRSMAEVELLPFRQFKTFGSRVTEVWEVAILAWEKE